MKVTRKNLLSWLSLWAYQAKHAVTNEPAAQHEPLSFRARDAIAEEAARLARNEKRRAK